MGRMGMKGLLYLIIYKTFIKFGNKYYSLYFWPMKLLILTFLSILTLSVNAQVPTNGLIAFFPFSGNANDSSSNSTDGTTHNVTLTTDRFGKANSAYLFSGNANSYIDFPSTYLGTEKYTYSLWAKANQIPGTGEMAFMLNIGSTGGDQSLNIANNYSGFNGWLGGGYNMTAPSFALNENKSPSTSNWAHIVCVRDSNFALLYIDGVLIDSLGSTAANYPFYGNGSLLAVIGRRNNGDGPFNGKIDDVCIYNRPLTKKEVTALYTVKSTSVSSITLNSANMILYPNPNHSDFIIDLNNMQSDGKNIHIIISNMLGQIVFNQYLQLESNTVQINPSLENGQYVVSIFSEDVLLDNKTILIQE
ncbi:MAG: hypothetical protein JWM28_3881 [Chitinophagaceae bacterium]|nr:hypothetical protein [Chitinophagaceae bacterium]